MKTKEFRGIAEKYFDAITKCASEMIQIPSTSGDEKAMAEYTQAKMKELGYDDIQVDRAGSVTGLMKGTGGGKSVMLNCHLDVVDAGPPDAWKHPAWSGEIAEGAIWGRGASDTKGTFAIQLYTPYILKQEGMMTKGDIYVVGVVHEEDAGFGAMIMAEDGFKTDYAIMGEATENDLAISCRGRMGVEVLITGKSCHASIPHEGANPFAFLGKFLVAMQDYKLTESDTYGRSSITPTRIISSEKGTNVLPNWIRLSYDFRSVYGETNESIIAQVEKIAETCATEGITVEVSVATIPVTCYTGLTGDGIMGEPSFGIDKDGPTVTMALKALEEAYGRPVSAKSWAFATDSGHFAQKGVEVVGFSPAEIIKCHTVQDNIMLDMLKEGIMGNLALVMAFCG